MLACLLPACSTAAAGPAEVLAAACGAARDELAAAPAPADPRAEITFVATAHDAATAVAREAADLATDHDDRALADLVWQLHAFPTTGNPDELVAVSHEAGAAILRIDRLARELGVAECQAATWRPDGWRALAGRHGVRLSDAEYRRALDRLCAATFPDPALLADGTPLLDALIADAAARDLPSEDLVPRLVARLATVSPQPSAAARFVRDFSNGLPELQPPEAAEGDHIALIAAFMGLDSAVPTTRLAHPPPDVSARVATALGELQTAWSALDITC